MPSFDVVSRNDVAKGQASKNTARRGLMMTLRTAMSPLRPQTAVSQIRTTTFPRRRGIGRKRCYGVLS